MHSSANGHSHGWLSHFTVLFTGHAGRQVHLTDAERVSGVPSYVLLAEDVLRALEHGCLAHALHGVLALVAWRHDLGHP